MDEKNIEEQVKEIILSKLNDVKPEQVTREARLVDDLGADSLDLMDMVLALEEKFHIDVGDKVENLKSVDDVINFIEERLK